MHAPSALRVVLVTHPEEGARAFARRLVERRVAACVNLLPVTSVFRWQGAIEESGEVLLVIKTAGSRLDELERTLREEHPYQVPESIALVPERVGASYLAWALGETAEPGVADA